MRHLILRSKLKSTFTSNHSFTVEYFYNDLELLSKIWYTEGGDTVDVLVPFLSGVGEATDAMRIADKAEDIVDAIDDFDDVYDAGRSANRTLKEIQEAAKNLDSGDNYVYIARGTDGIIEYVGITNDFARRETEWAAKGRKIQPYIKGLDRKSARIVEQTVIETFGMAKNGGRLSNKINSISPKNPLYEAVKSFKNSTRW